MNVLFVLGNGFPFNDAVSNLTLTLINQIKKNTTHNYFIVAKNNTDKKISPQTINGVNIEHFMLPKELEIKSKFKIFNEKKYNKLNKLFLLLNQPRILYTLFRQLTDPNFFEKSAEKSCNKHIAKLHKKHKFDLIISVNSPFYTSLAAINIGSKTKHIIYQMDPYSYNLTLKRPFNERLILEKKAFEMADKILVTDLLLEEYKNSQFNIFKNKMESINFPNIRKIHSQKTDLDIEFNKNFINCVFVGNIYSNIREPKFLINLISNCSNKNIKILFLGEDSEGVLLEYCNTDRNVFFTHKTVPLPSALNAMLNADILINIGNTIANQMPSKIFDYISTGKPIVNFCKLDNCPTLKYTSQYPICLNIFESKGITDDVVEQFEEFCVTNKGKQIDFEIIRGIYHDYTDEAVGQRFIDIMEEVMEVTN